MKKRGLFIAAVLAAALCAAGAVHMLRSERMMTADAPPVVPAAHRDFMAASLVYDAGSRTLRGTQNLQATNRTEKALEQFMLRLFMNAQDPECVAVTNVMVDGERAKAEINPDDPTLLVIHADWQPGETREISWTLMIRHEKTQGAAIITLPAAAMLEGDAWRADVYDTLCGVSYTHAFDYTLSLMLKGNVAAAFGGVLIRCSEEDAGNERLYTAQMQGARDVSFALLDGGVVRQGENEGVLITAIGSCAAQAAQLLARGKEALDSLERAGVPYPYGSLSIAATEAAGIDGDAYSAMAALDGEESREALLRRLTRLIARQTFGILVCSDPWNTPWMDISLASAAELMAFRCRKGEQAYETRFFEEIEVATRLTRPYGVNVGAGIDQFGGEEEMMQVLRDQGAAMLMGIEQAIGTQSFSAALAQYVRDNASGMADRQALEAALEAQGAGSWTGYLEDELSS